jgi:hypothetical protein
MVGARPVAFTPPSKRGCASRAIRVHAIVIETVVVALVKRNFCRLWQARQTRQWVRREGPLMPL